MKEYSHLALTRGGLKKYTLRATQLIGLKPAGAFSFFEDPKNLAAITPPWLNFRIIGDCGGSTCRGAEFDYTLRWFGLTIPWRTRITEYSAGRSFTDAQIRGPYRSWVHRHTFRAMPEGTLMEDRVDFVLPLAALPLSPLVCRQLEDIFSYRAHRVSEWAEAGTGRSPKGPARSGRSPETGSRQVQGPQREQAFDETRTLQ